jgi:type III restriction enzyme
VGRRRQAPSADVARGVATPILGNPFDPPTRWWDFTTTPPTLQDGRRLATAFVTRDPQGKLIDETPEPIALANELRTRVWAWHEAGLPGATATTKRLIEHWTRPDRERRLFFCQLEAALTLIYLAEAPGRTELEIPADKTLVRHGVKMATGSGKTTVMAMIIAWALLNQANASTSDRDRWPEGVLVICPNKTVWRRLAELDPASSLAEPIYDRFDLVSRVELPTLEAGGGVLILNWQQLALREDSGRQKFRVLRRGIETPSRFADRVLRDLGGARNILVLNDEAHHAWRIAPEELERLQGKEAKELAREATVWIEGLERIQKARGLARVCDFTATPYFPDASGHPEGRPFPWIVSDFGLVDAIEAGLVKVPRMPVRDNMGRREPVYFNLWEQIRNRLPRAGEEDGEVTSILVGAGGALVTLYDGYEKTRLKWQAEGREIPPVMIVVCNNTTTAATVYDYIGERGDLGNSLWNPADSDPVTLRVDSAVFGEFIGEETEASLRERVATVGKVGEPGAEVRCVVSVSMLAEGWDAQNVTHILGLRAFTSQLLCEQVVGRGLRRTSYDDFSVPEYVDIYGVPFRLFPYKEEPGDPPPPPPPGVRVHTVEGREEYRIRFPRVSAVIPDVRDTFAIDLKAIEYIHVDPAHEPTEVIAGAFGLGEADFELWQQNRSAWYAANRVQTVAFQTAARILRFLDDGRPNGEQRPWLFPQVLHQVKRLIKERVSYGEGVAKEELGLELYRARLLNAALAGCRSAVSEDGLLPIRDPINAIGTTDGISFETRKQVVEVAHSHLSHAVCDSDTEVAIAKELDRDPRVKRHVKNERLDFTIGYLHDARARAYRPDFLAVVDDKEGREVLCVLEGKGWELYQDQVRMQAARRWVSALNHHGQALGEEGPNRFAYAVCYADQDVHQALGQICEGEVLVDLRPKGPRPAVDR